MTDKQQYEAFLYRLNIPFAMGHTFDDQVFIQILPLRTTIYFDYNGKALYAELSKEE